MAEVFIPGEELVKIRQGMFFSWEVRYIPEAEAGDPELYNCSEFSFDMYEKDYFTLIEQVSWKNRASVAILLYITSDQKEDSSLTLNFCQVIHSSPGQMVLYLQFLLNSDSL